MARITAALVKELRDKTGAGMMDCKKALAENGGDMEAAVDWLRTKGLAAAQKKSGRLAADGLVGVALSDRAGALVEVNSETDFVARNDQFQDFVRTVAELALANEGDLDAVMASGYPSEDRTVAGQVTHLIATIGENMSVRRAAALSVGRGHVTAYVHNAVADGLGKIGVLVALESEASPGVLESLGKQLAMHVAAAAPRALDRSGLDDDDVRRERDILMEKAKASGKPANIVEKMVEGGLRKFYQEVVLLEQVFVVDGERKIAQVVEDAARAAGVPIALAGFLRFALGEGIEKAQSDFAAEVAAAAGG
ncbi:MAG: elongation factor Ts [Alphaproteobacteria bacterium]|nr:MAG: elongation factor Ts [Alphaproteobacteria bacterium]